MDYLEEVTSRFKEAIVNGPTPQKSLKINLKNLGFVVVTQTTVSNDDTEADTTITMGQKDFQDLVAGKLNPPVAFMQGKIKINGDPTAALQWLPVIQRTSGA
ncbi:MAG: SCP2 sterol-binding domain-containing protein [Pseudomonadota bacterium]|jgi:putative sterol carrier protein|nr:SCP2 sterol-binding domain-containing protein [Burkholderia sp. 4M9327F10]